MAAVIGSRYCNADATDIGVVVPVLPLGENNFLVTDSNNRIIFRVDDTSTSFHKQRSLIDSNETVVVSFREKGMTMHKRWQAFRGDSIEKKDLIFMAKQSSTVHSNADLNIYLAKNEDEKISDYRVDSSYVFYKGDSDKHIIAEAKEHMVKVHPNVDVAFIVSLIVILDGIREQEADNRRIRSALLKGGAKGGGAAVGEIAF